MNDEWREFANCKGKTSLFFPPHAERPAQRAVREGEAFAICAACKVRVDCEQASVGENGIWAGRYLEVR